MHGHADRIRRALALGATALLLVALPGGAWAQDADEGEASEEGAEGEGSGSEEGGGTLQRGNRMEFDARLIRGETAGSGAVFLFQRAPRALPSMVPLRKSYLQGTVDEVLGEEWSEEESQKTSSRGKSRKSKSKRSSRKRRSSKKR